MTRDEIIGANPIGAWLEGRGVKLLHDRKRAAHCPLKEHTRAGNVSVDHEKNLWHCHACNRGGTVIDWLALEKNISVADAMRELAGDNGSEPAETAKPKIVKTYDYTDETGNLLYQCVRYEPKDFRQRQPDGKGGWTWNLRDTRLVLYQLPAILKADEVWIVEGEKDADTLRALGFCATCNPMGAGKWRDEYSEALRAKRVVVVPDNDETGHKHADQVARSLHGIAASVKIVRLPDTVKDCSDFVATLTDRAEAAERLALLAEGTAEWTPTQPQAKPSGLVIVNAVELVKTEFPDAEDVIRDILPTKARIIISGPAKLGKTRFATGLVLGIATGQSVMGFTITKPRRILFFQAEVSPRSLQARLLKMLHGFDYDEYLLKANLNFCNDPRLKLTRLDQQAAIREAVERHAGEDALACFDPLYKYNTGSEDRVQDMTAFFDPLDALITEYGVSVLVVHHHGKAKAENVATTAHLNRGSSTIADWPDSLLTLTWEDRNAEIVKCCFDLRNAQEPSPVAFRRNAETLWFDPLPDYEFATGRGSTRKVTDQQVADVLGKGNYTAYTRLVEKIVETCKVSDGTARNAVRSATSSGTIYKREDGLYVVAD